VNSPARKPVPDPTPIVAPAGAYLAASQIMDSTLSCIGSYTGDPERAAYMAARLALLRIRDLKGAEAASEMAFQLADELATTGGRR